MAPHSCQLTEKVTAYPLQNPAIGRDFPAPHPTAVLYVPVMVPRVSTFAVISEPSSFVHVFPDGILQSPAIEIEECNSNPVMMIPICLKYLLFIISVFVDGWVSCLSG